MRFRASRTSVWRKEQPPCPEAFSIEYRHWIYYTWPPADVAREHRINPTIIEKTPEGCRVPQWRHGWAVDLGSLDDLMAFVIKHGRVIIGELDQDIPEIEIYDNYRE